MMQGHFWQTVESHGNDDRSGADRSVPNHVMILPWPGAHAPRQDGVQSNRDRTGKTDLAPMGMAAEQQIEIGMGSLPVYLRRVGQQNGKLIVREL